MDLLEDGSEVSVARRPLWVVTALRPSASKISLLLGPRPLRP